MLRRIVKLTVSLGLYMADQLRAGSCSRGVVLYYHALPSSQRESFAWQMNKVYELAEPWALDQAPPDALHWVGISFDDAYVSVLQNAVPLLSARCLPFTVFVPTGSLGCRPRWIHSSRHPLWKERVMSATELRELMQTPGATLGSHTVTHTRLSSLPYTELQRELCESKAALEDLTGRTVKLLSFPHGEWNEVVVEAALAAGYTRLFSIEPDCFSGGALPLVVGRVAVNPNESRLEFLMKLKGCYRWTARARAARFGPRLT